MVGTKGKSGGKRDGSGRHSLSEQFWKAAYELDIEKTKIEPSLENIETLSKKVNGLRTRILLHHHRISKECDEIEKLFSSAIWQLHANPKDG